MFGREEDKRWLDGGREEEGGARVEFKFYPRVKGNSACVEKQMTRESKVLSLKCWNRRDEVARN